MSQIATLLRRLSDDEPVVFASIVKLVALLAAGIIVVALGLDATVVASAVAALAAVDVGVTKRQRDNAIPLPKMRKAADADQAEPDEVQQ